MPRTPRIVIPGTPHHVTHRGNNRQVIFHSDSNRDFYLSLLKKYARKHDLTILGYCLMPNHIHLVVLPNHEDSMAKAIGVAHNNYARALNQMFGRCGHLWQARHYSCPLDDKHLVAALRYVEQNPVRSGTVSRAVDYPWSSAIAHTTGIDRKGIVAMNWWNERFNPIEWHDFLNVILDKDIARNIRFNTLIGQPLMPSGNDINVRNTALEKLA
ncbi:transposase [bacterium]|nr:transposase [bacterium]